VIVLFLKRQAHRIFFTGVNETPKKPVSGLAPFLQILRIDPVIAEKHKGIVQIFIQLFNESGIIFMLNFIIKAEAGNMLNQIVQLQVNGGCGVVNPAMLVFA